MKQVKVKFKTPEDALDFTEILVAFACNMDLKKSSRNMVDARSFMGILAMGLGNELMFCIYSDQEGEEVEKAVGKYRVF